MRAIKSDRDPQSGRITRDRAAEEARLVAYLRAVWPARLGAAARANLLSLYRGLVEGEGENLPLPEPHPDIPRAWLERDENGALIGAGGLSRSPTPHRLELGSRTLFAWCAFDCMFLPEVLDASLGVQSNCPASGEEIRLEVSPEAVVRFSPESAVISFVTPEATAVEQRLREVFCRHVRFFRSYAAASAWSRDDGVIITPAVAHRLGRIRNHTVFGDLLSLRPE